MTTIDQLIRTIDHKNYKGALYGHYIYDPDKHELRDKQPLLAKSLPTYAVVTSSTGAESATGTLGPIMVSGAVAGSWLELFVDYRAWVDPPNVLDLLRACTSDVIDRQREAPGARLVATFSKIVQAVTRRDPAAFDRQDRTPIEAMQREIEDLLLRTCGLKTSIMLRTSAEISAPSIITSVTAHASDFPSPIQLLVTVETFVRAREKTQATVAIKQRPPRYLEGLVEQTTRELVQELRTMQLRRDPHGEVAQRLRTKLEEVLGACFIRVRTLRLQLTQQAPSPPQGYEAELKVNLAVVTHPSPVPLSMLLHLELADEGMYWSSGGPALPDWLDVEAKRAVTRSLQGATYSQLCLEHQRYEALIRGALQAAGRAIGYEVTADIGLPRSPATSFRSPYLIEVSGSFTTALAEVTTELGIALQVQLDSLEGIRGLIDRGIDVEHTFTQAVLTEVAAYIHTIPPGQLFTYFQHLPPVTSIPGADIGEAPTETIQSVLHKRVAQVLRQKFHLRTLSFNAKLGSSHLRDVHDALLSCSAIEFSVEAQPAGHTSPVKHLGALEVRAIRAEDWATFQRRQPTIQKVAEEAARTMSTLLDQATNGQRYRISSDEIRHLAYDRLPIELRKRFGLTTACVGWQRELGKIDQVHQEHDEALLAMSLARQRAEYLQWQNQIFALRTRQQNVLLLGDPQEAEQIATQIKQLQGLIHDSVPSPAPALPRGEPVVVIESEEAST